MKDTSIVENDLFYLLLHLNDSFGGQEVLLGNSVLMFCRVLIQISTMMYRYVGEKASHVEPSLLMTQVAPNIHLEPF